MISALSHFSDLKRPNKTKKRKLKKTMGKQNLKRRRSLLKKKRRSQTQTTVLRKKSRLSISIIFRKIVVSDAEYSRSTNHCWKWAKKFLRSLSNQLLMSVEKNRKSDLLNRQKGENVERQRRMPERLLN